MAERFLVFLLVCVVLLTYSKQTSQKCFMHNYKVKCSDLKHIPKFGDQFLTAGTIDLSKNSINLVPSNAFIDFTRVRYINLSRNAIDRVEQGAFKHKQYVWIDLSFNKLKTLGREVFPDDKMLQTKAVQVHLNDNPWDCTCALKWMIDLMKDSLIRSRSQPVCSTPHNVKGVKFVELRDENYCIIQECLECDDAAKCIVQGGKYACACKPAYNGNGMYCADVDECAKSSTNDCKPNELCENFAGGYECICTVGFQRRNNECVDVNECEPPPVGCGPGQGICKNMIGSFKCICHPGLKYVTGLGCIDFDECKAVNDPCSDITHSTCVNKAIIDRGDKGYTCKCDEGYTKSGEVCVSQGGSSRIYVILGAGSGLFILAVIIMIVIAVLCRKSRNRKKKEQQRDFMMAPVTMTTPMDFAFMDLPQEHAEDAVNEEWKDMDSDE